MAAETARAVSRAAREPQSSLPRETNKLNYETDPVSTIWDNIVGTAMTAETARTDSRASEPLAPSSVLACFGTEINQSYTNSASAGLDSMAAGPSDNHSDDSVELPRASFGSPGMNEPHSLYYYDGCRFPVPECDLYDQTMPGDPYLYEPRSPSRNPTTAWQAPRNMGELEACLVDGLDEIIAQYDRQFPTGGLLGVKKRNKKILVPYRDELHPTATLIASVATWSEIRNHDGLTEDTLPLIISTINQIHRFLHRLRPEARATGADKKTMDFLTTTINQYKDTLRTYSEQRSSRTENRRPNGPRRDKSFKPSHSVPKRKDPPVTRNPETGGSKRRRLFT